MVAKTKLQGARDLDRALRQFPKSTARRVLQRGLVKSAAPLAEEMRRLAPDDPSTSGNDLPGGIAAGTKLSPSQRAKQRSASAGSRYFAEAYVGASNVPQAHLQEFGTVHHAAQPFARPAWESRKMAVLDAVIGFVTEEIAKAAARAERRAARLLGRGGR